MINVLYISSTYSGNYPLLNAQAALDKTKFKIIVCYLSGKDDGNNKIETSGCKAIYLNIDKKKARWYRYSTISKIRKIVEEENIHVINCHRRRPTEIGVSAALISKTNPAVFSTIHGTRSNKSSFRKLKELVTNNILTGIICVSNGVKEYIVKTSWCLNEKKVTVIQNGLPFDAFLVKRDKADARKLFLPEVTAKYWFGTAGRLSKVKNHKTLIASFAKFVATAPDSILVIAGEGPLEKELKELSDKYGINNKVFFLGFISKIPEFFQAIDIFVIPSLREGLCLALLEAMASALPVIASNVGGIPEVFDKAEIGRLLEPSDTDGFALAMKEMISLPEKDFKKLGANAKERAVTNFSSIRMIKGYENVFENVYGKRHV